MPTPLYFTGIDWADSHHDIVILDQHGHLLGSPLRIEHSVEGIELLLTRLHAVLGTQPQDAMACVIETRHGLLLTALLEAGFPVYPVNPLLVKDRRKASRAKTDRIDATILAKIGRSEWTDLRRLEPDTPLIQELKDLTRDQDLLIHSQTRLINQLTACLKAYYPQALQAFSGLSQPCTIAFLRAYPTPQALQAPTLAEWETFLQQIHYRAGVKRKAQFLFDLAHQPALHADTITVRSKARLLLALLDQLEPLSKQLIAYDEEITRLFLSHANRSLIQSLPRLGTRLAPRLLAEIGDQMDRYANASSLQALAGTCPVPFESGNYSKQHVRRSCNKPLRQVLQQFAWQSTMQEGWAKAFYERKRKEGKAHQTALRALANIWVRILFALLSQQQTYDADRFERAQQQHRPRVA